MNYQSQFTRFVQIRRIYLVLLLSLFIVLSHNVLAADDQYQQAIACTAFLPHDAVPASSLHLCTANLAGKSTLYACQDAKTENGRYRLYFKGGRHPKAIARLNVNNQDSEFVWQEKHTGSEPDCHLPVPPQLRTNTQFQGAGVCKDDEERSVPCAVFRERAPRIKLFHVYLTFYDLNGRGPVNTQHLYTGANQDAMPAELEFQIGLSLLKTQCCQPIGLKYIEHAIQLFPYSELYRSTYQRYQTELYKQEHDHLSFY